MDLSIIILTWNSEAYIFPCLESIFSSLSVSQIEFEVLVVDNGSKDNTPPILANYSAQQNRLQVFFLSINRGTTVSRNFALRKATGNYLCIMDSDVVINDTVIPFLMEILQKNSDIGLVAPKITYPNGLWQKSYDRFPTLVHKIRRFLFLKNMENDQMHNPKIHSEVAMNVDYAISAFWLINRQLIAKVGLLDERIFYSPEDVDFCLRIWKSGFRVVYVPAVSIVHHAQEISRGWRFNLAKVRHFKGLLYLFIKHRYFFRIPKFQISQTTSLHISQQSAESSN